MTKPECPLLVLSPQARSGDQVQRFKPFGGRVLVDTLQQVAKALSYRKSRRYERHAIFSGFYFGAAAFDQALVRDLRDVPSAFVDCQMYREQTDAAEAAQTALSYFLQGARDDMKLIVHTCNQECPVATMVSCERAQNDDALFAHLWIDLCGGAFRRIGQVMARQWGG